MGKLTSISVKAASKPGRYGDGDGLHLLVRRNGSKSWVLRFMRAGRSRDMGLGPFPQVSLKEARELAAAARGSIKGGQDPIAGRVRAVEPDRTFEAVARSLIVDKAPGWRSERHTKLWSSSLQEHVYPAIGSIEIKDIGIEDVLAILRPMWAKTPESASRLRGRIENVIDAAKARGWSERENPARWKGVLSTRLPSPQKIRRVEHHPSLPYQRIREFCDALRRQQSLVSLALQLIILTASRAGMVRGMRWGEVNLTDRVWIVPADRMKAGRVHRVPLSAGAVALLEAVKPDGTPNPDRIVFTEGRNEPLSIMAPVMLVRRMNFVSGRQKGKQAPSWLDAYTGEPVVPHGFRATFRVWAGEQTHYPREVVEMALAHTLADRTEAAYARTDLLERRRPLMEEWSGFCGF